nr:ubiquitin hydrolase [Tanacetum cinerariifolium]
MAKSSSKNEVFDNSLCSKDCKKNNDSLNSKITDLTDKLFDANNFIYLYKLALAQVESRLVEYKEREVKYCEKIRTLEFHNESNNECIKILKKKLETLKLENDGVDGKLAGLLKASKDLDNLIESQRTLPTIESTSGDDQNRNSSASENGESTDSILSKPAVKIVKAAERSTTNKVETVKKPSVKYAEMYRRTTKKPNVRGNQRNWNNLKSHQFGPNFVMKKKTCFNCGDFSHLAYDYRKRVKKGTSRSQNKTHESFKSKPVAHRPYRPPVRPVRTNMNDARLNRTTFNKHAHSYANRPFQITSAVRPQYRAPWVPTVNRNFPPVNRKLPTGNSNASTICCCCSRHVNTDRPKAVNNKRNWVNNVKASACWVWKPVKSNIASIILKRYDYVDKLENLKLEKDGVDGKLAGLLKASKDLDNLIESQRSDKNKDGLGYSVVPPPPAQLYLSLKKDLSWTGLPEYVDDIVTDYSRPSPTVESTSRDDQNKNSFASKNRESTDSILSKPAVKFVKAAKRSTTNKVETVKKPSVKYAEMHRRTTKKPNVRGNQRNWNNLKSHQLGPNFVMKKKACFNCGDFSHLAYDCRKRVKNGTSSSQNKTHESFESRPVAHRPYRPPVRPVRTNMNNARRNRTTFNKQAHSYANRPFQRTSAVRPQYRAPWVPIVNRNFPLLTENFPLVTQMLPLFVVAAQDMLILIDQRQ